MVCQQSRQSHWAQVFCGLNTPIFIITWPRQVAVIWVIWVFGFRRSNFQWSELVNSWSMAVKTPDILGCDGLVIVKMGVTSITYPWTGHKRILKGLKIMMTSRISFSLVIPYFLFKNTRAKQRFDHTSSNSGQTWSDDWLLFQAL